MLVVVEAFTHTHTHTEALSDRKLDMTCIQETQWKGNGCKFYGAKGKIYKLF